MIKSDLRYTDNVTRLTDGNGKTIFLGKYFHFTADNRVNGRLLFRPVVIQHHLNDLQILGAQLQRPLTAVLESVFLSFSNDSKA